MNIFILDSDPQQSAIYHVDKHVVKMILETAQLLSNAFHLTGASGPYALVHASHPITQWTAMSIDNWLWLASFGVCLSKEYTYRFGKIHASSLIIDNMLTNPPNLARLAITPFVQAMPWQYKNTDVVTAYRNYYNGEKQHIFKWTKRDIPSWITNIDL